MQKHGYYLGFQSVIDDKDKIFFASLAFNGLFCMDKSDGAVSYIGSFPNQEELQEKLYAGGCAYGDTLIFIPHSAQAIAVYDKKRGSFSELEIESPCAGSQFFAGVTYQNYEYMFPCSYPGIARFNLESGELDYFDDWVEPLEALAVDPKDAYFRDQYVRRGNRILIPSSKAPAVLEFDLDSCRSQIHRVGHHGHSAICFDGSSFWMAPRSEGPIVKWDPVSDAVREYGGYPDHYRAGGFVGCFYKDNQVWCFPECGNMVLCVDTRTGAVSEAAEWRDTCERGESPSSISSDRFSALVRYGTKHLLVSGRASEVFLLDADSDEIRRGYLTAPEKVRGEMDRLRQKRKQRLNPYLGQGEADPGIAFKEMEMWRLEDLIDFVGNSAQAGRLEQKTITETNGDRIYRIVKRELENR